MFPNFAFLFLFLYSTMSSLLLAEALSCPPKFGSEECKNEIANAPTSLQSACSEAPFASGCTIHRVCEAYHSSSNGCKSFNALVSICLEFPTLKSCSTLTNACGETRRVLQCDGVVDLDLPTTEAAYNAMKKICGSHYMTGCDHCSTSKEFAKAIQDPRSFTDTCYDPFGVYAHMCIKMDMIPCDPWIAWCKKTTTSDIPELCDIAKQETTWMSGPSSHCKETPLTHTRGVQSMSDMDMGGGSTPAQATPCIQDSTKSSCEDYVYPEDEVRTDISSLCGTGRGGMSWMPSCNLWQDCLQRQDHEHYCAPFTILATICADMPMMRGCSNYDSLCSEGSKVKQCKEHGAIPYAPKTQPTQEAIVDACRMHSMPQCSQCPRQGRDCPEPMKTLSEMCHAMPSMKLCQNYERFCSATHHAFASFCHLNSGDFLPPMRMYFHKGQRDIILFRDWIPESTTGYAFSFLAVVAMGIILQALKMGRSQLESYWHKEIMAAKEATQNQTEGLDGQDSNPSPRQTSFIAVAYRNIIRSGLTGESLEWTEANVLLGVIATLDFALMLVAMTFNVGLFIAVVLGLALGTLVLGQVPERNYVHKKESLASQINLQPYGDTNDGCCT